MELVKRCKQFRVDNHLDTPAEERRERLVSPWHPGPPILTLMPSYTVHLLPHTHKLNTCWLMLLLCFKYSVFSQCNYPLNDPENLYTFKNTTVKIILFLRCNNETLAGWHKPRFVATGTYISYLHTVYLTFYDVQLRLVLEIFIWTSSSEVCSYPQVDSFNIQHCS